MTTKKLIHSTIPGLIVLMSFVTILVPLQGQNAGAPGTISWGPEYREPANSSITKIIDTGPYGFYALRYKGSSSLANEQIYIELYDNKMKQKRSQKLELKYKGKRRDFEDLLMIGGELYFFTSFNNEAKKKNYLFYQKLSKRLVPSRSLTKIGEIDTRNKAREGSFDLVISEDSTKVLIYNQLPYKRNTPEQFKLRVFDNKFQELWSREITLPVNDDQFTVEEYRIDEKGNVYLLGIFYNERGLLQRSNSSVYEYRILVYSQEQEKAQEYKIQLGDKFITDLTFRISRDGKLVCSGFYSEQGNTSIKGTYFFRLDPQTREISNQNLHEFDFNFLTEYMSEGRRNREARREERGRGPELYRFSLDELILRSDGGALLIAEQFYIFEQNYRNWDNTFRTDYYYHYNDIIVVNIRPTGEIEWSARIPKRQETLNDGGYFSSYSFSVVRDRIYFIFNDNNRNYSKDNNRLYNFNGRYSVIALTELRKDGSWTTYPLFTNRDAGVITRPKICKQIGARRMMVYGEDGRSFRFANLEFE